MIIRIPVRYIPFVAVTAMVALASCSRSTPPDERDILVRAGNAILSRQELQKAIPYGLSPEDSAKFAKSYIAGWIDNEIIDEIALSNIHDTREIDRMVADYRRELIMREYRKRMSDENATASPTNAEIEAYYEAHKEQLRTSEPLLRGTYIKTSDHSPHIAEMRRWYRSTKPGDIDRLEKVCIDDAVSYDYFRDRWVEWSVVESKIPYDFGTNPDQFLRTHKSVDTTHGGSTYLLAITEYLPAGSIKPIEIARPEIKERLIATHRMEYDRKLRKELYDMAIKSGEIVIY